jgi:HD-GYP domain-containing protein (c-di-GMP phosphodiesterase class II)
MRLSMWNGSIREKVEELVTGLVRAVQIHGYYGREHKLTQEAVDNLHFMLNIILAERAEVTIGIIGDEIAFGKEPLHESSKRKHSFIEHLKAIGVKKISFSRGVEKPELYEFVEVLTKKAGSNERQEDIKRTLRSKNVRHISVGDIGIVREREFDDVEKEAFEDLFKEDYKNQVDTLTKTFEDIKGNQPLNVQSARQIVEGLIGNLLKNRHLLLLLTSIRRHNENTFEHSVKVATFTLLQAEMLGVEETHFVDVGMAALLHDIGTLSNPSDAVEESEIEGWPMEDEVMELDRKRAMVDVAGAKILLESEDISPLAAIVAFEHNINYDGSGFPMKLFGKDLNLLSMMIAISDQYDLLRKKPDYYQEGGPEKAYEEMMELSGIRFHPDLLNNFFSIIGVYPPGVLVELSTKEVGLVIQPSVMDIRRPQVEILYDVEGNKLDDPYIVNLMEKDKNGVFKRSVVKTISPFKFQVPSKYTE